jgi:hypothetical protein
MVLRGMARRMDSRRAAASSGDVVKAIGAMACASVAVVETQFGVVGQGARSVAVATAGIIATAYREQRAGANDAVAMTLLSRWDDRARFVALRVER